MGALILILAVAVLCGVAVAMRLVRCFLVGLAFCLVAVSLVESFRIGWQYEPEAEAERFVAALEQANYLEFSNVYNVYGHRWRKRVVSAEFVKRGPARYDVLSIRPRDAPPPAESTSVYRFRFRLADVPEPGKREWSYQRTRYFRVSTEGRPSAARIKLSDERLFWIGVGRVVSGWVFRSLAFVALAGLGFVEYLAVRSAVRTRRKRREERIRGAAAPGAPPRPTAPAPAPPPTPRAGGGGCASPAAWPARAAAAAPAPADEEPPAAVILPSSDGHRKPRAPGAVASVVWGAVGLPLYCLLVPSVLAMVYARRARRAVEAAPSAYRRPRLASVGLSLGVAGLVLGGLFIFGLTMAWVTGELGPPSEPPQVSSQPT